MCCDISRHYKYIFAYLPPKLSSSLIVVLQEFPFANCGTFVHGVNCDHVLTLQTEANAEKIKNVNTSQIGLPADHGEKR